MVGDREEELFSFSAVVANVWQEGKSVSANALTLFIDGRSFLALFQSAMQNNFEFDL